MLETSDFLQHLNREHMKLKLLRNPYEEVEGKLEGLQLKKKAIRNFKYKLIAQNSTIEDVVYKIMTEWKDIDSVNTFLEEENRKLYIENARIKRVLAMSPILQYEEEEQKKFSMDSISVPTPNDHHRPNLVKLEDDTIEYEWS